ncbi:transcription factor C6 Ctf1B, partial [Aspergillus fumigatus]
MESESQSKRKASAAGLSANSRPVKRRASKACCCCRARKVRCDVVENGSPLFVANIECRHSRKSRIEVENGTRQPSQSPADGLDDAGSFLRRLSESHGLNADIAPESPSQQSVDLDQGHHMPHLL